MKYRLELSRKAFKALSNIPIADVKKIKSKIDKLGKNPFLNGSIKLAGSEDLYRIRSGDYRVIYQVRKTILLILVIKIGHRREVYR